MSQISPPNEATVTHLQAIVEREKADLARSIHDELGGYLIASAMDVTVLRHRFAAHDEDTRGKFDRLSTTLGNAIDMMRRITEDLHPTLLDNVGLFAALRWQIKHMCHRSNVTCTSDFPDLEPPLSRAAAIALYRAGQDALVFVEDHPDVRRVDFKMVIDNDSLTMQVIADGSIGPRAEADTKSRAIGFLSHRMQAMGGKVFVSYPKDGGVIVNAEVSLPDALAHS
jgi:signal transduction histidine kinase